MYDDDGATWNLRIARGRGAPFPPARPAPQVGSLLDVLEASGLRNDTLFIFTSDNGPWNIKGDWRLGSGTSADAACLTPLPGTNDAGGPRGGLAGNQGPFAGAWQAVRGGHDIYEQQK